VLRYVVRRLRAERVGVLVARRGSGDDVPLGLDGPPVGAALRRLPVGPLDPERMHALLTGPGGLPLPRRVSRAVHRVAGGNPFYGLEIGRAVHRSGARVLTEHTLPLPGGLLGVPAQRVAALGPAARRVLAAAALLAAPTPALVVEAGDAEGLAEAVDEGLLAVVDGGLRFAHPLLRAAAAAALPSRERRALHRRLAALVADPDERAVHLAAGATEPDEPTAAALSAAARRAFARGAPDTAAVLAERAVALSTPDAVGLGRRVVRAAEYRYRAEDAAAAATALAAAVERLPPGEDRADALLLLAMTRHAQNAAADAIALATDALAGARSDLLRSAVERELAVAHVITGDPATADRHAAAALAAARASGDPASIAESGVTVAWTQFWTGRGLRADLLEPTRTRTGWTRFTPHGASPNLLAALLLGWADRTAEARAALRAEDTRLTGLGHDRPRILVQFALAELECRAGNLDAAAGAAAEGRRAAELTGDEFYGALADVAHGLVAAHRGRLDDAREAAHRAVSAGRAGGAAVAVRFGTGLLGFVALAEGDAAAAHGHLGPLVDALPADGAYDPGLARFVPDEVEALVRLGDPDRAAALLDPFAARAADLDRPWAVAAAGRCRALLLAEAGDTDAAAAAVEAALAAHDRVEMPFERARTLQVAGSVRRRARRREEARAALREAEATFARFGADAWADRVRDELERLGARSAGEGLTETESRVADLVAAGRSNREIAAALFVTTSTVEATLWKVYRKLGLRSRAELAARQRRS
jgi:DNA-binding NarL/FixJ family response regulator